MCAACRANTDGFRGMEGLEPAPGTLPHAWPEMEELDLDAAGAPGPRAAWEWSRRTMQTTLLLLWPAYWIAVTVEVK